MNEDRRAFHRIFFDAPVTIECDQHTIHSQLLDISLNGALVKRPEGWTPTEGRHVNITISLSDDETSINMETCVSRFDEQQVGLKRIHIDVDSITHLRRLVELNLGQSDLLDRDLEHLFQPETTL